MIRWGLARSMNLGCGERSQLCECELLKLGRRDTRGHELDGAGLGEKKEV